MNKVKQLIAEYGKHVSLPWSKGLAGAQKVWFAVYRPTDERRLRLHLEDFETATRQANHGWCLTDVTCAFAEWMAAQEYREAYFECPEDLTVSVLDDFLKYTASKIRQQASAAGEADVVAVLGVASLFGFKRTSELMKLLEPHISGRLLVFYPGDYGDNNYRLLDARDGWNYLATPITAL